MNRGLVAGLGLVVGLGVLASCSKRSDAPPAAGSGSAVAFVPIRPFTLAPGPLAANTLVSQVVIGLQAPYELGGIRVHYVRADGVVDPTYGKVTKRCLEKAPGTTGTVKIMATVAANGSVTKVEVRDTPTPALGACVAGIVRSATFPASRDGLTFVVPFTFQ